PRPLSRGAGDVRDGARRRHQPGRLRPQGQGHLLHRRDDLGLLERRVRRRPLGHPPGHLQEGLMPPRGRRARAPREPRELDAKAIPRAVAGLAVEAAFVEVAEAERCLEAGRRRLPALLRAARERAAPRLRDYLLRRGYPPGMVMRTVATLTGARPDGDLP